MRVRPADLANRTKESGRFAVAETLLIAVLMLAGFVVLFVVDVYGKARAFEHGQVDPAKRRPPEAVTSVDLPPPRFNQRDQHQRRRES
jgi:hypothetical protein